MKEGNPFHAFVLIIAAFSLLLGACSAEEMKNFVDFNDPPKMAASYLAVVATITLVLLIFGQNGLKLSFGYGLMIPSACMLIVSPYIYLTTQSAGKAIAIGVSALMGAGIGAALSFWKPKKK